MGAAWYWVKPHSFHKNSLDPVGIPAAAYASSVPHSALRYDRTVLAFCQPESNANAPIPGSTASPLSCRMDCREEGDANTCDTPKSNVIPCDWYQESRELRLISQCSTHVRGQYPGIGHRIGWA
eukprot:2615563-Rhodomonas_salina.1